MLGAFKRTYPASITGWLILNAFVSGVENWGAEDGISDWVWREVEAAEWSMGFERHRRIFMRKQTEQYPDALPVWRPKVAGLCYLILEHLF